MTAKLVYYEVPHVVLLECKDDQGSPILRFVCTCDSMEKAIDRIKNQKLIDKEKYKIEPLWSWKLRYKA